MLRIADVDTVRDREGRSSHTHEIARRLGDRCSGTDVRIQCREPWLRIDGERDTVSAALDAHHCGIGTRTDDRIRADHLIVRSINDLARRDRRRSEQIQKLESDLCSGLRRGRGITRAQRGAVTYLSAGPAGKGPREHERRLGLSRMRGCKIGDVVLRRVVGERSRRQRCDQLVGIEDLEERLGGHFADPGAV